jgi:ribose 1,5-bisphosphokinase
MSFFAKPVPTFAGHALMEAPAPGKTSLLGPGRLVLIVGPSGAGKDTLISGARCKCANEPAIVFPRRVVTRSSSAYEDHETLDVETFNQAQAAGRFALWWDAHGHRYGIPISIDDDIHVGRTVVCNVSRTIVDLARRRYARVAVVLITAPPRVLKARLARRDRESDGNVARRLARSMDLTSACQPDVVIRNVARPDLGIRRLLDVIRDDSGTLV